MKKNITTKEFINNSIGEWKSIRSTHTLAFQEFENTNSNLLISNIDIKSKEISDLTKELRCEHEPSFAIKISWDSTSEWTTDNETKQSQTILIFMPKDNYSGIILKNKGYVELIPTFSKYFLDESNHLIIKSDYNSTISEEKIWFLSKNVRSRYSVIKNKDNHGILQTSHATEIRKIFT